MKVAVHETNGADQHLNHVSGWRRCIVLHGQKAHQSSCIHAQHTIQPGILLLLLTNDETGKGFGVLQCVLVQMQCGCIGSLFTQLRFQHKELRKARNGLQLCKCLFK